MLLSSPPPKPAIPSRRIPTLARRSWPVSIIRLSLPTTLYGSGPLNLSENSNAAVLRHSQSCAPPQLVRNQLGLRRDSELGLVSLLFVISMVVGSFISLAAISLPALSAFRRLAISMDKLSKVVSEEVPGTLSSLKLSGLEINDLTCQLNYLRQRISGNQYGKKVRTNKQRSHGGKSNPIIN